MLTWVGKRPLKRVTAFPAQLVETFNPLGAKGDWQNLLFHGDNKEVLAWLLANGFRDKVNLIYIDPPFDSGADYVRKVQLRGASGIANIDGEAYSLGEQIQYTDIWANDSYLQFMYERVLLLKGLLATNGAIFVHVDPRRAHHIQCLLDEVFGQDNFQNSICWKRSPFAGSSKARAHRYPANHDVIFFYSKSDDFTFKHNYSEYSQEYLTRFKNPDNDPRGPYRLTLLKSYSPERFEQWKSEGRLASPKTPGAGWSYKQYLAESKGVQADDFWDAIGQNGEELLNSAGTMWGDINLDNPMANARTDYPTQKPEALIERVLLCCSSPGDIVLDGFIGSGTTAAVAQKLGRRWIGCDINKGAIRVTSKRVQTIIREQMEAQRQGSLLTADVGETPKPVSLAFSVYRVNDYDIAIQHNEAVNLACEHLGVQRTRTDACFDGTQGKKLVKIVPLTHPLTLLDLEEMERELKSRPKEDRDVLMVCLGKELAVDGWLAERNRHRPVNKIEVIELRTDKKYGKFFTHRPATARVDIKRAKGKIVVEIKDFISPSIIERLNMDQTVFKAQITDWRAMVDSVMIDTAYDGQVFNVALTDVPERKVDLVAGRYELPAPTGPATVAVKITDMLGEEVLVAKRLE
ncbi:MAG TPA: site-specific DNA-methyltransferase [Sedimentisphaerales bacterium]|nr:site-specific DNA-methyltransferase [Sedimentisphaerales bacterium]